MLGHRRGNRRQWPNLGGAHGEPGEDSPCGHLVPRLALKADESVPELRIVAGLGLRAERQCGWSRAESRSRFVEGESFGFPLRQLAVELADRGALFVVSLPILRHGGACAVSANSANSLRRRTYWR